LDDTIDPLPVLTREERTHLLETAVAIVWKERGDPATDDEQRAFDVRVSLRFAMAELIARENLAWQYDHGRMRAERILAGLE
jgi:hypothetical protein